MKTVVILGAAGGVGMALSEYLSATGQYTLRGLVAPWDNEANVDHLRSLGIEIRVGNVTNEGDVKNVLQGVWGVVNCAAMLPERGDARLQHEVNGVAPGMILRVAHQLGLEKKIFISTAGVASHGGTAPEDETAPYRTPQNPHVASKIEGEQTLDAVGGEIADYAFILRPASIYGIRVAFRWPEIIRMVRAGRMAVFGDGRAPYPLIHERDLARAIGLALAYPARLVRNEKIIVSSDEALTLAGIVDYIADYFRVRHPIRIPFGLAYAASWFLRAVPRSMKPNVIRNLTPLAVKEYIDGHAYRTEKAKQLLGFEATITFKDGMDEMLAYYK